MSKQDSDLESKPAENSITRNQKIANAKANGAEPPGNGANRNSSAHSGAGRGDGGTLRKEASKSPDLDKKI